MMIGKQAVTMAVQPLADNNRSHTAILNGSSPLYAARWDCTWKRITQDLQSHLLSQTAQWG
jgi:hypothetical protein